MATHSSVLAWRIPGTGEPGGLPSLGSHRVGHNWSDLAAAAAAATQYPFNPLLICLNQWELVSNYCYWEPWLKQILLCIVWKPAFHDDLWITLPWYSLYGFPFVAQVVKHLPVMQDIQAWSLGQEDPLEKEMATHSSILAWKVPWTEEPSGLQSMGSQRVRHDWATNNTT